MRGGKHLLLLAALVLVTSQQDPQVLMLPDLKQVYYGDFFYLTCNTNARGDLKWFHNDKEQSAQMSETWEFAIAAASHSGSYRCEVDGRRSNTVNIGVLEWIPRASLILETGQPVMRTGSSVVLQIDYEDGLLQPKWRCFVHKGGTTRKIMLALKNDTVRLSFQAYALLDRKNIFWCADKALRQRSNQIVVWTSDKRVSLEMYPVPVMAGESVTLKCLTWGTDQISQATFHVNNSVMGETKGSAVEIPSVAESEKGSYNCSAVFMYRAGTAGLPYNLGSDLQDLYIYETPVRAELSRDGLSCSCSRCPKEAWYRWYCQDGDGVLKFKDSSQRSISPWCSGTYSCRAVWEEGRSLLSESRYQHPDSDVLPYGIIVLVVLGLACIAVGFYVWYRRRRATGEIYEDVQLNKLDNQYEPLQMPQGARREGEYDTLHAGATGRKEGERPPLQKDHAPGREGPQGEAGGYEALTREGRKEEVYHTLGEEGAGGGGGGYEALKKQETAVEIYHTLELPGAGTAKGGQD